MGDGSKVALCLMVAAVAVAGVDCVDEELQPLPNVEGGSGGAAGGVGGSAGAGGEVVPFELDPQRVFDDVAYLASPELQGRAPSKVGNDTALDYVETLFSELGLEPAGDNDSYRQAFGFDYWSLQGPTSLAVDGTPLVAGTDYLTLSYSGAASLTAEIVFVGYGMTVPPFSQTQYPNCPLDPAGYDDYAGIDVGGKIALVLRHGPSDNQAIYDNCPANGACNSPPCLWLFGYKAANADQHGAAAMLLVEDYRHPGNELPAVTLGADYFQPGLGVLFVDRSDIEAVAPNLQMWADAIDGTLQPDSHATGVNATVAVDGQITPVVAENILGAAPGSDAALADEVVIVGAHIDHLGLDPSTGNMYLGADDNASGSAVMLELARALMLGDVKPARTVLFAAWNAEELGLIGSCYYVNNPIFPLSKTTAMFSVDMVGGGAGSGVDVYGGTPAAHGWLTTVMQGAAADHDLDFTIAPVDPSDASDHACFNQAGAPAVMISTPYPHPYYHTPEDTIDNITVGDLEAATRVMWATLETLATGAEGNYLDSAQARRPASPPRPMAHHHRNRTR